MEKAPDRRKLRQEYLKTKAGAYVRGTVGATLLLPAVLTFFLLAAITLVLGLFAMNPHGAISFLVACIISLCLTIASAALVRWCWRVRHEFKRASELPYVPPVTAATLPAEEILVRGSEEPPVQQSEVLLRAAKPQETPEEELLRIPNKG
jgi:hypothetical protein